MLITCFVVRNGLRWKVNWTEKSECSFSTSGSRTFVICFLYRIFMINHAHSSNSSTCHTSACKFELRTSCMCWGLKNIILGAFGSCNIGLSLMIWPILHTMFIDKTIVESIKLLILFQLSSEILQQSSDKYIYKEKIDLNSMILFSFLLRVYICHVLMIWISRLERSCDIGLSLITQLSFNAMFINKIIAESLKVSSWWHFNVQLS